MRNPFFRNGYALSRPRVAPHAGRAPVDGKTAKTPDFNSVATHQRVTHGVKKGLDGEFGIAVCQLAESGCQFFY